MLDKQARKFPGGLTINIRRDLLQLLYDIEEGLRFDIVLMDTTYPSKPTLIPEQLTDGFQAAEKIRQVLPDTLIVFITTHTELVFDAFRIPAFRFIPEQEMKDRLPEMLHQAYRYFENNTTDYIFVETTEGLERIRISDIVCCERSGNYVVLEMISEVKHKVRGSLKSFRKQLPYDNFIEVNRILVNPAFIQRVENQEIFLLNGRQLHAAKGQKKQLLSVILPVLLSIVLSLAGLTILVFRKGQNFAAGSGRKLLSDLLPGFIAAFFYLISDVFFAVISRRGYRKQGLIIAVLLSEFILFLLILLVWL